MILKCQSLLNVRVSKWKIYAGIIRMRALCGKPNCLDLYSRAKSGVFFCRFPKKVFENDIKTVATNKCLWYNVLTL